MANIEEALMAASKELHGLRDKKHTGKCTVEFDLLNGNVISATVEHRHRVFAIEKRNK